MHFYVRYSMAHICIWVLTILKVGSSHVGRSTFDNFKLTVIEMCDGSCGLRLRPLSCWIQVMFLISQATRDRMKKQPNAVAFK